MLVYNSYGCKSIQCIWFPKLQLATKWGFKVQKHRLQHDLVIFYSSSAWNVNSCPKWGQCYQWRWCWRRTQTQTLTDRYTETEVHRHTWPLGPWSFESNKRFVANLNFAWHVETRNGLQMFSYDLHSFQPNQTHTNCYMHIWGVVRVCAVSGALFLRCLVSLDQP